MKRPCIICGKDLTPTGGMTDGCCIYTCEGDCFNKYMNNIYGQNQWKPICDNNSGYDNEGGLDGIGGFYLWYNKKTKEYEGTGMYYTEWE